MKILFRTLENTQIPGGPRSAILKPRDTLALSGAMNLSRSTEDLKPPPTTSTLGKILKHTSQESKYNYKKFPHGIAEII